MNLKSVRFQQTKFCPPIKADFYNENSIRLDFMTNIQKLNFGNFQYFLDMPKTETLFLDRALF